MEPQMRVVLNRIAARNNPEDVRKIKIEIGQYRVYALHSRGFIKQQVNAQANELERELRKAVKNYQSTVKI